MWKDNIILTSPFIQDSFQQYKIHGMIRDNGLIFKDFINEKGKIA